LVVDRKGVDFQALVKRRGTPPQGVWVRVGTCRKAALIALFDLWVPALMRELEAVR
jgi:predicted nuclease of predicted toxin-antitoxin system